MSHTGVLLQAIAVLTLIANDGIAQTRTVGTVLNEPESYRGYTLFTPMQGKDTYLIDNEGRVVRTWTGTMLPGASTNLLPDGRLLRTGTHPENQFPQGGAGGAIEIWDWDGALLWQFFYSSLAVCQHHDAVALPNGNILLIAWERVSRDSAIAAGRDPNSWPRPYLWPDRIVEVKPTDANNGEVVWMWRAWDHIIQDFDSTKENYGDPAAHPELIDVNFRADNSQDWLHSNGIDYNERLDQIALTVHNFGEVWIIDHSTTMQEAAGSTGGNSGKGGTLLYRWGNPRAYRQGTAQDQKFFGPHDAHWISEGLNGAGNMLIFNNGLNRPGDFSTIDEIATPVNPDGSYAREQGRHFAPDSASWMFKADPPTSMYSKNISGAQRLPNGNTLICIGATGRFIEVTEDGRLVWAYVNPVTATGILKQGELPPGGPAGSSNSVFKIRRYGASYPGLAGKDLTPGDFIEIYETSSAPPVTHASDELSIEAAYPQPASGSMQVRLDVKRAGSLIVTLHDVLGREKITLEREISGAGSIDISLELGRLPAGVYLLRCKSGSASAMRMLRKTGRPE